MAVVKANAYGHGAVAVSRYLAAHDAQWFGVATLEEAQELRRAGIRQNILILGTFFPSQAKEAVEHRIHVTASSMDHLNALNRAGSKKRPASVHLKFDTGMGRLGFSCNEADLVAKRWAKGTWLNLKLQGLCSHLASAEEIDSPQNPSQAQKFSKVLAAFEAAGVQPWLRHLANSAGSSFHAHMRLDLVRAGIALYGYEPRAPKVPRMGTAPALSLKTRVLHLKAVPRGAPLGYDGTFITRRPLVIATLPIGYADGVDRRLSFSNLKEWRHSNPQTGPMNAIVHGQLAPIVGRVSMDLTLLDVSEIKGIRVNDEVVLLGHSGSRSVRADDWAGHIGTIPYEVLCAISPRVYRVYPG